MGNIEPSWVRGQEVPLVRTITCPFITSQSLTFIKHVLCARCYSKFIPGESSLNSHDSQGGGYHDDPHFRIQAHNI